MLIDNILIDKSNSKSIYKQIVDSVLSGIEEKSISKGDKLPSINKQCKEHGLSQDTVLRAYAELKSMGVITSTVGKGYFVGTARRRKRHNVLLIFDKLTAYKESLYNSFREAFKGKGQEQIYFHHGNIDLFETLIDNHTDDFSAYVIMPVYHQRTKRILKKLPKDKVYILDYGRLQFGNQYAHICQHFENDTYNALAKGLNKIQKYKAINLVTNQTKHHFNEIIMGFEKFCADHQINGLVRNSVEDSMKLRGQLFVVTDDHNLVELVKRCTREELEIGKDVGIISYNDTPFKEIIAGGITTISTDFKQMGKTVAEMILKGKRDKIKNPSNLILRKSL